MPTTASTTFTLAKLEPAYPHPHASPHAVAIKASSTIPKGTVLGQVTIGGAFAAYVDGNNDGTQVARGIAMYDMATDASGNITLGGASGGGAQGETYLVAPIWLSGAFRCEDLTGLDANAVTDLGRLAVGNTTSGLLHVI